MSRLAPGDRRTASRRALSVLAGPLLLAGLLAACASRGDAVVVPLPEPRPPIAEGHRVEDRIVAVLDEEAILLSDIDQVIGLGLIDERPGESLEELRGRVLEGLIDQRLRFQQVDRFGLERVSVSLVESEVAKIAARFPDRASYLQRLAELEMTEEELDQLVARQLMVLSYVEERLGGRIFVGLDDIRAYYEEVLAPGLRDRGSPVPPLEEVREDIRGLLRAERLNVEIAEWTARLRRQADIQVFLFEPPSGPLPPLVQRLESEPPAEGN